MPQGGFGNLIALPLQRGPRDQGNSVFVDDDLVPWPDQWAFLAGVRRARSNRGRSDRSGGRATRPGSRCAPSAAGRRRRRAMDGAAFTSSPGGADCGRPARRPGTRPTPIRSTSPRTACIQGCGTVCSGWRPFRIRSSTKRRRCGCPPTTSRASSPAPRTIRSTSACRAAAWTTIRQELANLGVRAVIRDERQAGRPLDVTFSGELRPEQAAAAEAMAVARYRRAGGDDGIRQDGRRRMADRPARSEHAGPCPPASTPRSMGRATLDVPWPSGEVDRPCGRRPQRDRQDWSMSPSFRASSRRASSTIASPTTATSSLTSATTCRRTPSSRSCDRRRPGS